MFQVAALPTRGPDVAAAFFKYLEREVEKGKSYRGKVLSLDVERSYTGQWLRSVLPGFPEFNAHRPRRDTAETRVPQAV